MICADHNILFIPFFAADEAQTLDAVLRNDQSAVESMSDIMKHIRKNDNDICTSSCYYRIREDWERSHGSQVR